jgi:outer membrane protein OmpA-like peptidoglycan-associated protein
MVLTSFDLPKGIIFLFAVIIFMFGTNNYTFSQHYSKVATWHESISPITRIQLSSNEQYLAAGDNDGTVYLWSLKFGTLLKKISVLPSAKITDLDFSHDNKFMSIASYNGFVQIFSLDSLSLVTKIALPKGENLNGIKGNEALFARFDAQNGLYFGGLNMMLSYYDINKNESRVIYKFTGNAINCAYISSNLKTLALGVGAELYLFDTDSKRIINKMGKYNHFEDLICEISEMSASEWLIWKMSGELFLANIEKQTFELYLKAADVFGSAQFKVTDSLLITGNQGLNVNILNKYGHQNIQILNQHTLPVKNLSATHSGSFIATGDGAKIYIWCKNKEPFIQIEKLNMNSDSLKLMSDMPIPRDNLRLTLTILFEQANANLKMESLAYLEKLFQYLTIYPNIKISLEGHTDNYGSKGGNLKLSILRAQAVAQYLINKGIAKERISTRGFGGSKPIADNKNAVLRKKNRRVEMLILK